MVAMSNSSRIALITGANRGIGRATALALGRDGIDIVVTYHSHADEAAAVVDEITSLGRKAVSLQLDTGATDSFDAFVASVTDALRDTWGRETFDLLAAQPRCPPPAAGPQADVLGLQRLTAVAQEVR